MEKELLGAKMISLLSGDLSDDDGKKLFEEINASKENQEQFLKIRKAWFSTNRFAMPDLNKEWQRFEKRINSTKENWIAYVSKIAAVFIIGFLGGYLALQHYEFSPDKWQSVEVPYGSRSTVYLADGTEVILGAGSLLEYPAQFNKYKRNVRLNGEAYFTVAKDESNPFVVHTSKFQIKVYGTEFNVEAFNELKSSSVSLVEGSVSCRLAQNESKEVFLEPGQKLFIDRQTGRPIIKQTDINSDIAWIKGQFNFKNIPFAELAERLERWYDVKINYSKEEFDGFVYTGKFRNQETIWQVLDAIELTSSIKYERKGFREFELKLMNE